MILNIIICTIFIIFMISIVMSKLEKPTYSYKQKKLPGTFNKFYKEKLKKSNQLNVRPHNEEKLIRHSTRKTEYAILYIHGYGTCRAEGEYVVDKISKKFKANTYYLRLPGHGTNYDDHFNAEFYHLLDESLDTVRMMKKLGKKVIVIGTSMGGLIANYAAALYPKKIDALILASPFYNFGPPAARLLYYKPLYKLIKALGLKRDIVGDQKTEKGKDWTKFWYPIQHLASTKLVIDLSRLIAKSKVFEKIKIPVLLFYYYKDKKNQDQTASVREMLKVFDQFGDKNNPNKLNKKVQIENGHHVLMSKFWVDDKKLMIKEITEFIKKI